MSSLKAREPCASPSATRPFTFQSVLLRGGMLSNLVAMTDLLAIGKSDSLSKIRTFGEIAHVGRAMFQNRSKQDCFCVPQQPSRSRLSAFNYAIEAATPTLLVQEGLASVSGASCYQLRRDGHKTLAQMLLDEGT